MSMPMLPPVPSPSDQWVAGRRAQLVREFTRQRRRRAARLAASGASAVFAAIAILVLVLFGSAGAPRAFAGWTATPTTPSVGQLRTAESECREPGASALVAPAVADARGPYTMLLFVEHGTSRMCIVSPSFITIGSGGPIQPAPSAPAAIAVTATGTSSTDGHPYSFMIGRVGTAVRAISLTLEDGTQVRVTTAGGWFAAWWPGRQPATRAQVTSRRRTITYPLATPPPRR